MPGKLGTASARDSPPSLRREATSSCVHSAMASKEELAPEIIARTETPMALPQCNRRKKAVVSQTFGLCS